MVATSLRESIIIHNTQNNCTKLFEQTWESGPFSNTGRPEVNYKHDTILITVGSNLGCTKETRK